MRVSGLKNHSPNGRTYSLLATKQVLMKRLEIVTRKPHLMKESHSDNDIHNQIVIL